MYFKVGPAGISRLCADFEYCCERRKVIERARTLKKEEKSFYKFHSFTFTFPFCPTLPLSPQHLRPKWPFSRRARGLAPIQPIRSIRRHISLFVIASNSSGRYPTGDKRARNLNKTNQYSNPLFSFSLAGSLSGTPSPSPFFFLIYFVHLYFLPHFSDFVGHLRLLGLFLVCSDSLFIGTISKRLIYSRLFVESGDLLSKPFQPLYWLGSNSPNDWFYTRWTVFVSLKSEKNIR